MTSEERLATGRIVLVALFVTALVTAQLTASKLLMFELPFGLTLPVTGSALVMPGAALAYALTFFASDCYSELYGRRAAQVMVNVGFAMTLVMLALVYTTIEAPSRRSPASVRPNSPACSGRARTSSSGACSRTS